MRLEWELPVVSERRQVAGLAIQVMRLRDDEYLEENKGKGASSPRFLVVWLVGRVHWHIQVSS